MSATLAISVVSAPAAMARPIAQPTDSISKGSVVPASLFGMHVYNAEVGSWPTIPVGAFRLWDTRTTWSTIEPVKGQFNWSTLDTAVSTSKANGVNDILMVLAGTPLWASDDPRAGGLAGVLPGAAGMPTNIADWDNWVTQVATRYK